MNPLKDSVRERSLLEALYEARQRRKPYGDVLGELVTKSFDYWAPPIERFLGKRIESDGSQVVTSDALNAELLHELFTHRICGIRLPNYCASPLAHRLTEWVLRESGLSNWSVKDNDRRVKSDTQFGVGLPKAVGFSSKENFVKYFTEGLSSMRRLRTAAAPDMSPIDRLRLELDELWPQGANIARFAGRTMFAGVARVMTPDTLFDGLGRTEGMCHVDSFPVANPNKGFFSVNVYLQVPPDGGELDIWNISPSLWDLVRSYSAFKRFANSFNPESQRIIRAALPAPLTVRPNEGDVIIINTARPHSVRGFSQGVRVTLQTFLSYQQGKPLSLVS